MPTRDDICWELCKRNLDTRRFIILGALTVVTTFGIWAIQQSLVPGKTFELRGAGGRVHDVALISGCAVPWILYFIVLGNIDRAIKENFRTLATSISLAMPDKTLFLRSMNFNAKFLPFILGMTIYTLILLPL